MLEQLEHAFPNTPINKLTMLNFTPINKFQKIPLSFVVRQVAT